MADTANGRKVGMAPAAAAENLVIIWLLETDPCFIIAQPQIFKVRLVWSLFLMIYDTPWIN